MKINRPKLLSLFQLDGAPSCRESSELARAYIVSCAEALEKFGEEEPADRMNEITVAYTALVEHGDLCDACQGAAGETPHTQT